MNYEVWCWRYCVDDETIFVVGLEPAVIFGFLNRKHSRGKELIEIQNRRNDVKCSDCMSKENMQEWHMLSFDDYMQLKNSRHCSEQIF